MEQCCGNCKYYYSGKCNNKQLQKSFYIDNVAEDEFVYLTENGLLSEYLQEESDKAYSLANKVMEILQDKEYLKKSKYNISFEEIDKNDDFIMEFVETMDDIISSFILPRLRDINISYDVNKDFCCKYWE